MITNSILHGACALGLALLGSACISAPEALDVRYFSLEAQREQRAPSSVEAGPPLLLNQIDAFAADSVDQRLTRIEGSGETHYRDAARLVESPGTVLLDRLEEQVLARSGVSLVRGRGQESVARLEVVLQEFAERESGGRRLASVVLRARLVRDGLLDQVLHERGSRGVDAAGSAPMVTALSRELDASIDRLLAALIESSTNSPQAAGFDAK